MPHLAPCSSTIWILSLARFRQRAHGTTPGRTSWKWCGAFGSASPALTSLVAAGRMNGSFISPVSPLRVAPQVRTRRTDDTDDKVWLFVRSAGSAGTLEGGRL